MTTRILIIVMSFGSTIFCSGQTRIPFDNQIQDSICQLGKKYDTPERIKIRFPEIKVTDDFKINEIHKAIPDSLSNEENEKWWFYDYYFVSRLIDYDSKGDSTFTPTQDNFLYKLKDTYFFDINGDGVLDFIHYPQYYMAIMRDQDTYELFIQLKTGYKWITFSGFILDIVFIKTDH